MPTLTIRGLDDETRTPAGPGNAARPLTGHRGESDPAGLGGANSAPRGLGSRIHARFAGLSASELELPSRDEHPRAADFEGTGVELVNPWGSH